MENQHMAGMILSQELPCTKTHQTTAVQGCLASIALKMQSIAGTKNCNDDTSSRFLHW